MNFKSLHARLAMGLLGLLVLAGVLNVVSTLRTTRLYLQEMDQQLDAQRAERLAAQLDDGDVSGDGVDMVRFDEVARQVALFDPGLHVYGLWLDGRLAWSDPESETPSRDHVSLAPIRQVLEGKARFPTLGDDPRRPERPAPFAVARWRQGETTVGYLYLVRPTVESRDSWLDDLTGNYILRLSARNGLLSLGVVLLAGTLLFGLLTRPLRRLGRRMGRVLRVGDAAHDPSLGDDVASLERAFEEMDQRIQSQMQEIERMEGLRNELISNISHDLRTPIASLQGYLDTLTLKEDVLSHQERDEYLKIALNQAERLGKLVDELFEITKLENFAIEPQMERFRLAELVQDIVQGFQLRARQQGVAIEAELNPDLPPVYVDVRLMERALENLIDNALRFTPEGGTVRVVLQETPYHFSVRVQDTGSGIAPEDLPHIFDRYYQARFHSGKTSRTGAGLGLAITRRIVELHQSELEVESTLGKGSTFSFSLPIAPRTHQIVGLDTEGLNAARLAALRRHQQRGA